MPQFIILDEKTARTAPFLTCLGEDGWSELEDNECEERPIVCLLISHTAGNDTVEAYCREHLKKALGSQAKAILAMYDEK